MSSPPAPRRSISGTLRAGLAQMRHADWAKPIRNIGVLLLGRGAQAVFSLVYVAMAARTLGPRDFGILVLIHSMAMAISDIARFQTWQFVLHYGAGPWHERNMGNLRRVLKFSLVLDAIGVAIGLVVMFIGAPYAAMAFGIPETMDTAIRLYGLSIIFMVVADTPNGLLRLLDRFDLAAWQNTAMPAVRLVGSVILAIMDAGLYAFLILWFGAAVFEHIVLFVLAWREAVRRGIFSKPDTGDPPPWRADKPVWWFCISTSVNSSLQLAQSHLGTLAVGWLLGPAPAGLFRIASQVSSVLVKPLRQLFMPAILPELSHLRAAGRLKERMVMVRRVSVLTGLVATGLLLVLILIGKPAIALLAGQDYVAAYGVMVALAAGGTISAWAVALEPLLISNGKVHFITAARTGSTLLYLSLLYPLTLQFGLMGAGYAAIVQAAVISLLLLLRVTLPSAR